jgi:hypothetical protein
VLHSTSVSQTVLYKVSKVNNKMVNESYSGKVLAGTKHSKPNRGTIQALAWRN